jgi:hypothetical protein
MSYLIALLKTLFGWLVNLIQAMAEWLWSELLGALMTVLNAIPVPSWLSDAPAVVGSIPSGVAFFLQAFEVPSGLAIIFGAYTIRFIIRRIPLIG